MIQVNLIRRVLFLLIIFYAFVSLISCNSYLSLHYDGVNKVNHNQNKFVFLAALIDEYYKQNGFYPLELQETKPLAIQYFQSNSSFQTMYLGVTWSNKPLGLFSTATGKPIRYSREEGLRHYFLYGSNVESASGPRAISDLKEYLNGEKPPGLYLIFDGRCFSGPFIPRDKEITVLNMLTFMRPMDYKKHSFLD